MRDVALLPQALGQCSHFLATNLPTARLVKVSSTAAAAEAVSTQAGDEAADSAAICSKICLQLFGNLEMLQEGIQDSHRESEPVFLGGSAARRETFRLRQLHPILHPCEPPVVTPAEYTV